MLTPLPILLAGSGKLATELLTILKDQYALNIQAWPGQSNAPKQKTIVIHAGSGRELGDVIAYCQATNSILIELATGTNTADCKHSFPVVLCPNTNILMLKFMAMLASHGHYFKPHNKRIIESHQAEKSSVPGTAVNLAQSLGIPPQDIVSIRNPSEQKEKLHIESEHLPRHAYHKIVIEDSHSSITLETKVVGSAPYADGVAQIITVIGNHMLENRLYNIIEFVDNGWI